MHPSDAALSGLSSPGGPIGSTTGRMSPTTAFLALSHPGGEPPEHPSALPRIASRQIMLPPVAGSRRNLGAPANVLATSAWLPPLGADSFREATARGGGTARDGIGLAAGSSGAGGPTAGSGVSGPAGGSGADPAAGSDAHSAGAGASITSSPPRRFLVSPSVVRTTGAAAGPTPPRYAAAAVAAASTQAADTDDDDGDIPVSLHIS